MSFDPEFLTAMPYTVQFFAPTGSSADLFGKRTFGDAQPARAGWKTDQHEVMSIDGQTRVAAGTVWVPPPGFTFGDSPVAPLAIPLTSWEIQLPDGLRIGIVRVDRLHDDEGLHHVKVSYG